MKQAPGLYVDRVDPEPLSAVQKKTPEIIICLLNTNIKIDN